MFISSEEMWKKLVEIEKKLDALAGKQAAEEFGEISLNKASKILGRSADKIKKNLEELGIETSKASFRRKNGHKVTRLKIKLSDLPKIRDKEYEPVGSAVFSPKEIIKKFHQELKYGRK